MFQGTDEAEHGLLCGLGDDEREWREEKADEPSQGLARLAYGDPNGDAGTHQHRPGDGLGEIREERYAGEGAAGKKSGGNHQRLHYKTEQYAQHGNQSQSSYGRASPMRSKLR